jgi:hypothetical protein
MKSTIRTALLLLLAAAASTTVLGINVLGFGICEKSSDKIAVLERIMVDSNSNMLVVALKPTSSAEPGYTYTVDLYERGDRRATSTVSWTQVQVNVQQSQAVSFPISPQEAEEYAMVRESQLRKTFSVKVR